MSRARVILAMMLAALFVATPATAQDQAPKKRAAKKRAAKKRAAKKRPAKKRPAKKRAAKKRSAEKTKKKAPKGRRSITLKEAAKRAANGEAEAPSKATSGTAKTKKATPKQAPPEEEEPRFERVVQVKGGLISHFRDVLGDFGAWHKDASLGLIWVPSYDEVGINFAPYVSGGHWEITEKGSWTWASDYDWGHIPFHYGRWEWTESHGWAWVPGTRWAPAWVVWRLTPSGYDYTAWAPTPATYIYQEAKLAKRRDGSRPAITYRRRARKGNKPLRFMFVFNQYLFDDDVGKHVIWDPDVNAWLGARSKTYRRHHKALLPASPTFEDASVPDYWTPLGRIELTDERIRPFVVTR